MSTIAIIGGGFAGTLTAVNLMYQAHCPLRIVHIECSERRNRGAAFGTESSHHLLNVPAGRMSAFPDDPLHFLKWARSRNKNLSESSFLPRSLYGEYLDDVLEAGIKSLPSFVAYEALRGEAISIKLIQDNNKAVIKLADGNVVVADKVVLATGNFKAGISSQPAGISETIAGSERYFADAWSKQSPQLATTDGDIMMIGTGLTAIDKILELEAQGFKGNIHAISRHGLLPAAHLKTSLATFAQTELRCALYSDLNLLFRSVKNAIRSGSYKDLFDNASSVNMEVSDWRQIIDSLRPHSQSLWGALSETQKRRFCRHLKAYWDVHRHRMPPEIGNRIAALQQSDRLKVIAGRLYSVQETAKTLVATIVPRSGGQPIQLKVANIINCTGFELDFEKADSALAHSLLSRGLVKAHPTRLGLDILADGNVLDGNDRPSKVLYTLGAPTIGARGESIAVPELRVQAKELAGTLLSLTITEQLPALDSRSQSVAN
ncbi:MAG: FAD/NAD(P)-binding protein [Candidatus Melainabacteria bacterium]|nr:FAD/NAD(P)-binding protein [Candidatus Melainabacteria bacterium]